MDIVPLLDISCNKSRLDPKELTQHPMHFHLQSPHYISVASKCPLKFLITSNLLGEMIIPLFLFSKQLMLLEPQLHETLLPYRHKW